jgi:DNA-binding MarR family transcriptional regulator
VGGHTCRTGLMFPHQTAEPRPGTVGDALQRGVPISVTVPLRMGLPSSCICTLSAVPQTTAEPDDLVASLLVASRALVAVAAHSLADVDEVTLPQFRALVVLSSRPGSTVSELAEALDIHPTTATRLCDRLVRKRLVRRTQGIEDRRATEVRLAARGRHLVDGVTERRRQSLAAIAARMPPGEWRAAARAFKAFAAAAGEPTGIDLFGWELRRP